MSDEDSRITDFFRRIGKAVVGLKRIPQAISGSEENGEKSGKRIPSPLQNFFKNRNAGWPEYVMLKAQINIILLFALAAILILTNFSRLVLLVIFSLLTLHAAYLTLSQIKEAFGDDYPAYRTFVGMCVAISWSAYPLLEYLPDLLEGQILRTAVPIAILMGGSIGAFLIFRLKYGRDYTYGVVQDVRGEKAKVRTRYDLKSNVKHGTHFVDCFETVEAGDEVKIEVDRSTMGLTGSSVKAIVEKVGNSES